MLLSVLMKSLWRFLLHTHEDMYTLITVVSWLPSGSPNRCGSHTQPHIDKHSQTHLRSLTCTHIHKPGPTGHFPYPGTTQWALCTPSHLPTPALTINRPPASSTSLFKWEIMQMSSHHCGTPHTYKWWAFSEIYSVSRRAEWRMCPKYTVDFPGVSTKLECFSCTSISVRLLLMFCLKILLSQICWKFWKLLAGVSPAGRYIDTWLRK